MKKFTKILACSVLSLSFLLPLTACGGGGAPLTGEALKDNIIDDQYDNYYQIFPYSFCDSDGDGVGDINGITSKLGYVRDMGYTGIWLNPINPSSSYHGYDVTDYKAVSGQLGQMEDFEAMVTKAHSLGIKVILDLVLNHSSSSHDWFTRGAYNFMLGETAENCPEVDYYNFSFSKVNGKYEQFGSIYYEAQFNAGMPDFNLDSELLREQFADIIEFWIKEKKVDGFRLDAALHFYEGNNKKSAEFTKWVKETADAAYKTVHPEDPNAETFVVGEVWSGETDISDFFEGSGGASFFDFRVANNGSKFVPSAINTMLHPVQPDAAGAANNFYESVEKVLSLARGKNAAGEETQFVPTPFLCNHDVGRIAGVMLKDEARIKFAYGLLSLYTGSNFTYYGDEIGMTGSSNDPEKRVGMLWEKDTVGIYPPGAANTPSKYYPFPSVEEQLADEGSILNYYKHCNLVRNAYPALMRGTPKRVENSNENVLVFTKTYKDETITIVVNFSQKAQTVKNLGGVSFKQGICVSGEITGSGSSIRLPEFGIAILA